ncbi:MAG: VCBS repeat-containing protein [Acidobacteria bacterium]|nr:VCBS repeat-containing protein [Acidobacteriota bacterium]MBM3763753.1 VCBS repeat-containing protein [Acidobacteriota bacterium]
MRALFLTLFVLQAQTDYRVKTNPPRAAGVERILTKSDAREDHWLGEQDYEAINALIQKDKRILPWPAGLLERFRKLDVWEVKIVASNRERADETSTTLGLRIELGGEAAGGGRLTLIAPSARAEFVRASTWSARKLELGPVRETSARAPGFIDITERALGHNTIYREQLAKGLDDWRAVLDEATGVDVYGHNGISVGDYNGDGLEDLYVCQPSGLPNRLLRNNGDGTFDDVSATAGVDVLDATTMALFADFDNDRDQDLLLVAGTQIVLMVNDGKGHYSRRASAGFARAAGTLTSAAVADFDRDGWLDIYVCAYDFWTAGATYDAPTPYYDATNGPPNQLYRNRGNGTFVDVTAASGMNANNNRFSFAAAWADYDRDGWPDLYVANDFGRNNLYRNRGDGTFEDVAARAGVEDLGAGMSVSWGDYDGDGWLDIYISNMWSSAGQRLTYNPAFTAGRERQAAFQRQAKGNSLFRNKGDGTFEDVSEKAGVEFGRWAWGSGFVDCDNDGRLDLLVKNGYITGPDTHDL